MIIEETPLAGACLVRLERHEDERGSFARTFCQREFAAAGLDPVVAQCNLSTNRRRGTLRGLHWQVPPHQEAKLVRCSRGRIWDVIVDLRLDSGTYLEHFGVELAAAEEDGDGAALYVPPGMAHGFITLTDDAAVLYQMSAFYLPEAGRGARWDDPAFGIEWPLDPAVISERDRNWPEYEVERAR